MWIIEERGLRQMDLERGRHNTQRSVEKNIQGFDETFQDTASPRMIYVIARLRCVLNPGFHFLLLSVIC